MNIDKLQIDTSNQQAFELYIEFPISVLAEYNGISNLDETWDDNIMYIINQSLSDSGVSIKKSEIVMVPESIHFEEKLCYHVTLIPTLQRVDLNSVVISLKKENFHKGLCILKRQNNATKQIIYKDKYHDDNSLNKSFSEQDKPDFN